MKLWIEKRGKKGSKGYAEIFIDGGIFDYINATCIGRLYQKHLKAEEIEAICDTVGNALKNFENEIKIFQKIQPNIKNNEKSESETRLFSEDDIVYLAGPMSGKPWLNYLKFFGYAGIIRKMFGCTVINPAARRNDLTERLYELQGYADLSHCTKAVFMDGYRLSTGAMLELSYCQKHGIPVIEQADLDKAINKDFGDAEL